MTPIENTIEISRAPDVVFSYLTDLHREHEWNEQLRSVAPLTDGPLRVGAKFRVRFGRGVGDSIIEYRHFEPPVSWQTTSTSKRLDVHFAGTITPAPHGSRVTLHTELLPHGLLHLAAPLINHAMHRSWDQHLTRVKAILEA